jgi:hypothetical protein
VAGELQLLNRRASKKGGSHMPRRRHGHGMGVERRRRAAEYGGNTVGRGGGGRCGSAYGCVARCAREEGRKGGATEVGPLRTCGRVCPSASVPSQHAGACSGAVVARRRAGTRSGAKTPRGSPVQMTFSPNF